MEMRSLRGSAVGVIRFIAAGSARPVAYVDLSIWLLRWRMSLEFLAPLIKLSRIDAVHPCNSADARSRLRSLSDHLSLHFIWP